MRFHDTQPEVLAKRPSKIRRVAVGALASFAAMFAVLMINPGGTFAVSDTPPVPTVGTTVDSTVFGIPASTSTMITALVLPIIGGLILRSGASKNAKAAVMIVLSAIAGLFATATTEGGDAIFSSALINNFIITTVIAVGTLYGIYQNISLPGTGGMTVDAKLKSLPGLIGPKPNQNGGDGNA